MDQEEIAARIAEMRKESSNSRRRESSNARGRESQNGRRDFKQILERMMAGDKNGDGKLTADEAGPLRRMFSRIDANKDGYLDREEIRKTLLRR
ncbi:MAG: hypothetical protein IH991_07765 [Planctomycetes bacterium]|nr:hypothetical protein [Planctomycetota bacterium]